MALLYTILPVHILLNYLRILPVFITMAIVATLISCIIYFFKKHRHWKKFTILGSMSIFTLTMGYLILYHIYLRKKNLNISNSSYIAELEIPTKQKAIAYVPLPNNLELRDSLKIVSGKGKFKVIKTAYGEALEVRFSGKIRIEGRNECRLTTRNQSQLSLLKGRKTKSTHYPSNTCRVYYKNLTDSKVLCKLFLKLRNEFVHHTQSFQLRDYFVKQDWQTVACKNRNFTHRLSIGK